MEIKRRTYWIGRMEEAWRKRSVVWLAGVRRTGKTVLTQSLDRVEYFDCDLPRVRRMMEDPESFLDRLQGKRLVLDEIHRLRNPSELLKIAADHFPRTKIVATGSSTLAATTKFRDTLTGRKIEIGLTPMTRTDLRDFGMPDLEHRLHRGGLPPFFLSRSFPEADFQSWMDDYWAKDIQELFRLERHHAFQRFVELLLAQSGGIFEATAFAGPCEISRTTVHNYLKVLEITRVAHVVRPFSRRKATEIIAAPKVYGFDTGFVSYYRGWRELREEDKGSLWEHYVLNEIQARIGGIEVRYWRDKRGHEVDFVLLKKAKPPLAVETKWSADHFEAQNVHSFRQSHPEGRNLVVCADVDRPFQKKPAGLTIEFLNLESFIRELIP